MPEDGSATALMDYNAMLLPLYKNVPQNDGSGSFKLVSDLDPILLDRITGRYHPYFTKEQVEKVKYLSISRTSNLHSCKPKFKFYYGTLANDFLGLSLLDEDLQRIEGSDVAINVDKWLLGNMTAIFHDFQIVAGRTRSGNGNGTRSGAGNGASTSTPNSTSDSTSSELPLKDQLFVFPSGHIGTFGMPIDIRRVPPHTTSSSSTSSSSSSSSTHPPIAWDTPLQGQKYKTVPFSPELGFMYGTGFEVRFLVDTTLIQTKKAHARGDVFFDRGAGIDRGKNFHFFEDRHGKTYMELWPHGSHRTVPVNFIPETDQQNNTNTDTDSSSSSSSLSLPSSPRVVMFPKKYMGYIDGKKQRGRKDAIYPDMIEAGSDRQEPKVSFQNKVPKHERPYKRFRGTSQIIDMVLEGKDVKVGISHTVAEHQVDDSRGHQTTITDKRAYLSQFYAFEPEPPFEVVAKSGHFCFNHMSEDDIGYAAQWISGRPVSNRTAPITIKTYSYRCPIITFAAGLNEMIGYNGENVIITYGVNDCYSRSLIVPKKKIEMLLLGKSEF